ncbi:MAG: rhodanese-like domain-containing protein [Chloroflexota bacterium]|nr:MAG: rhodanese-like domain-containing protein [Chloroflexota bacterium]
MPTEKKRPIYPLLLIFGGIVLIIAAVASILILSGDNSSQQNDLQDQAIPYPQVERVKLFEAKSAFDQDLAVFVDVRDEESFESGHIPGAISIPLNQLSERLEELNPNDWIILYCT